MNEPVSINNYAQLITISQRENDASDIESYLRNTGLPVKMLWLQPSDALAEQLREQKPDMVFCDEQVLRKQPECLAICTRTLPYTPVLLLAKNISAEKITQALRQRARDVVSAGMPEHLHAVYLRELGVCRLQQQLNDARNETKALEERLDGIVSSSGAAVVNVQEGIVVDSNPRFATLFGLPSAAESLGMPFMDYIHPESQKEVKSQMSRCLKGKGIRNSLNISALGGEQQKFPAALEIKLVHFEGEAAIEVLIKSLETATPARASATEAAVDEAELAAKQPVAKPSPPKMQEEVDPRTQFYQSLEDARHYPPHGHGLSLGYFVVDNSARIKHELGLANADQFLGRIATFVNKQIPGAKVFRLGTDEFVLIAPGKLFKHGEALARNFRKQINEEVFDYAGKSVMLTVSIAINLIDQAKNSGARFAEARDQARAISAKGGNRVLTCDSAKTTDQTDAPVQWKELQQAIANNQIRLATRPIASLEGDTRQYYEAYPRMPDGNNGLDSLVNGGPQDTHPQLQIELDRKLVMLTMGMLKSHAASKGNSGVFVPVSSCSLEDAERMLNWLLAEYKKAGLNKQEIVLTLSEEVLAPHIHRLKELIRKLEGQPVKFAISDCAGTEQSIKLIQNVPGHFLRLTNEATRALCEPRGVKSEGLHEAVSIAKEHGYKIIAASTGDAHSMAVLWQLGVNYVEAGEIDEPVAA